jgi:hypothetical protein
VLSSVDKIDGLLASITLDDIEKLPPANRRRLAQMLRHAADIADPPSKPPPTGGVLRDLGNGARAE